MFREKRQCSTEHLSSMLNVRKFQNRLSVPHNIIMNLNNVMFEDMRKATMA